MPHKKSKFTREIKDGSVIVKIYRALNKGRHTYVVAYYLGRQRKLKTFVCLEDAQAEAKSIAGKLARGEQDVLQLCNADRVAYVRAVGALQTTGVPLELAALQFAEAWNQLNGRASLVEATRHYGRRQSTGYSSVSGGVLSKAPPGAIR